MACVISPVLLRQTPFRYTETLMWRRCNVWQPRMTDERGLNWHDDTVCCFDLPFRLQNGPVINLERSLKADELIRTATQLRSLPLFVCPVSPFMSWDPQLSATLVSTVPFFLRTPSNPYNLAELVLAGSSQACCLCLSRKCHYGKWDDLLRWQSIDESASIRLGAFADCCRP